MEILQKPRKNKKNKKTMRIDPQEVTNRNKWKPREKTKKTSIDPQEVKQKHKVGNPQEARRKRGKNKNKK